MLSENSDQELNYDGLASNKLNVDEAAWLEILEIPFIEDEVYVAFSNLNGDKALSPNGYAMVFWIINWFLVKEVLVSSVVFLGIV